MHKRREGAPVDLDLKPFLTVDRDDGDPHAVVELERVVGFDVHFPELEGHLLPDGRDRLAGRVAEAASGPGVQDHVVHGGPCYGRRPAGSGPGDLRG